MGETKTLITAEQLLETAGDNRVELVCGELVKMTPIGIPHWRVVGIRTTWLGLSPDDRASEVQQEEVPGDPVFPGFRFRVSNLFRMDS